ncbi:MAG: hypothetical protein ACJAUD_001398 [Crocinitomicaceae bacterium]|jgi:hypothetical protein
MSFFGYNSLDNNRRPLSGTFKNGIWDQPCSKAFQATLNEPGDDKWDGVFSIKFVGYQSMEETDEGLDCDGPYFGAEAMGSWKSNNGKLTREFNLEKVW